MGVSARFLQALLAAMPVERQGPLSDHGLLQRYLQTPQTAGDAFYQVGGSELFSAFALVVEQRVGLLVGCFLLKCLS